MCSWLGSSVSSCLRPCLCPFTRYARMNRDDDGSAGGEDDALLWSRDLEKHSHGEFSFAMVQANEILRVASVHYHSLKQPMPGALLRQATAPCSLSTLSQFETTDVRRSHDPDDRSV